MTTTRSFLALSLLLAGGFQGAAAQERNPEVEKLQTGIEEFFRKFNDPSVGPEMAFTSLVGKGPLKDKTADLSALVKRASKLEENYGRYAGHDVASVKTVGSDLAILRYLYKGERFPVVWHFYYYRTATGAAGKEWSLIEIRFDTNLDGLDK